MDNVLNNLEIEKAKKMLALGEEVHYLIRSNSLNSPALKAISLEISKIDKEILESKNQIPITNGVCPNCGTQTSSGAIFCNNCGTNLQTAYQNSIIYCKTCGSSIHKDWHFCPVCGNANGGDSDVL